MSFEPQRVFEFLRHRLAGKGLDDATIARTIEELIALAPKLGIEDDSELIRIIALQSRLSRAQLADEEIRDALTKTLAQSQWTMVKRLDFIERQVVGRKPSPSARAAAPRPRRPPPPAEPRADRAPPRRAPIGWESPRPGWSPSLLMPAPSLARLPPTAGPAADDGSTPREGFASRDELPPREGFASRDEHLPREGFASRDELLPPPEALGPPPSPSPSPRLGISAWMSSSSVRSPPHLGGPTPPSAEETTPLSREEVLALRAMMKMVPRVELELPSSSPPLEEQTLRLTLEPEARDEPSPPPGDGVEAAPASPDEEPPPTEVLSLRELQDLIRAHDARDARPDPDPEP